MTIDEYIEVLKLGEDTLDNENLLQLAEWLEELKDLREYQKRVEWTIKTQSQLRAEVIDEFINELEKELLSDEVKENLLSKSQVGVVISCAKFISEQLKEQTE